MLLDVTEEQRSVLVELIQREIGEMGPEIHHTKTTEYRENLRARKNDLEHLLDRLTTAQPVGG